RPIAVASSNNMAVATGTEPVPRRNSSHTPATQMRTIHPLLLRLHSGAGGERRGPSRRSAITAPAPNARRAHVARLVWQGCEAWFARVNGSGPLSRYLEDSARGATAGSAPARPATGPTGPHPALTGRPPRAGSP